MNLLPHLKIHPVFNNVDLLTHATTESLPGQEHATAAY